MLSGLRRRLLVMLLLPLLSLALLNAWFDYQSAGDVAQQQERHLVALMPLFADSVIGEAGDGTPMLLLAPPVAEFLKDRPISTAFALTDPDGRLLYGDDWLAGTVPPGPEPEFHAEEHGGSTWRIVRQRQQTVLGELVVSAADAGDPRQQWLRSILLKVLLPNLVLIVAAAFAVGWAVERALKPLLALKDAVERRSPRDLSTFDEGASPEEVRPLVQSLNRLFELVNAQAESQRRFVADAAHQLRTPLAGLQSQVEAWAQAANAEGGPGTLVLDAEEVNKLRNAARRTSQLANQLLALSRADARTVQAHSRRPVELKALCEDMLSTHLDAAAARRIDLGLDAEPALVLGHDWLLRELLSNLVDNAVRYTPEGGTVTIRCRSLADRALLEVEDDGPGVPEEQRTLVLERFYRVPGTHGEGNGLGLAIAREIARVHHGDLVLGPGTGGRGLRASVSL
ncbi:sensor histidine kinase [Ramlibacter algicola]|uniref:histidine kinase n=1 Tax=Ramlibacter algicola TaxID=2795217 RepID=A0A934Q5G7_9BURK|nr:ATP-binding protein [Ramlibacter algicola]MBK0394557.1 sensor histidine kinase N-terminal domain-containing protein [Ramlibacter algicola]